MQLEFVDTLSRRTGEALSYVFLISVGVMAYEVGARYLFGMPTIWAHETTICLTAIGFIFGGAYAMQRSSHIRITIVYELCPAGVRRVFDFISALVTIAYLALLAYAAWIVAARAWAVMETSASAWNQPTPVLLKSALVLGAALMCIQGIAELLRLLSPPRRG